MDFSSFLDVATFQSFRCPPKRGINFSISPFPDGGLQLLCRAVDKEMAPGLLEYDEILEPEVKSLHPSAAAEPGRWWMTEPIYRFWTMFSAIEFGSCHKFHPALG